MEASISPTLGVASRPRQNPIVRLFSSIWFGIILLTLITLYACVASAFAPLRGALELTEMQIFQHWTFVTLVVLFVLTMAVATWTRIRWNLTNLGVLMVHGGLILLTAGAVAYFGSKVEGDVKLFSPRVDIVAGNDGGQRRVVGSMLAETDSTWRGSLPEAGGEVELRVLSTNGRGVSPVAELTLQARVGGRVSSLDLSIEEPTRRLNDRLTVMFSPANEATKFYDAELAALYEVPADGGPARLLSALHELPRYRERFLPGGPPIHDDAGQVVQSKRTRPTFLGTGLWTGWLEPWRMPIDISTPDLPFDLRITGYLPYCEQPFETVMQPLTGDGSPNPALHFTIEDDRRRHVDETLFASDPRQSLTRTQLPFEFVWVENSGAAARLLMPPAGPNELTVELTSPPFRQTFAVTPGQTIRIPDTAYELTVEGIIPSWPMVTPPYENAMSAAARVQVKNGQIEFNRTVIQRFPQLSQDIDAAGKRHRDPLDPNIRLTFRTCANGYAYFVAGPGVPLRFALLEPGGQVFEREVKVGEPMDLPILGEGLKLKVTAFHERAEAIRQPIVTRIDHRRPGMLRQLSAVRLEAIGRSDRADWRQVVWVRHSDYPDQTAKLGGPEDIAEFRYDGTPYRFVLSRMERDLRATLANRKLTVQYQPGQTQADRWRSDFNYLTSSGETGTGMVETNVTDTIAGWTYFQSGAPRENEWAWTILGVGNRIGIWPMVLGSILIPLGSWYAFYIKPWLIRRRQRAALAAAADRQARMAGAPA
jgi:hypothetical protein